MASRRSYTPEDNQLCEAAYVEQGLLLEEIAEQFDVGIQTLKNWSTGRNWKKKRKDYEEANSAFRTQLVTARDELMKQFNDGNKIDHAPLHAALKIDKLLNDRPDPKAIMLGFAEQLLAYILNHPDEDVKAMAPLLSEIFKDFAKKTVG